MSDILKENNFNFAIAPKSFDYLNGFLSPEAVEKHFKGHHLQYNTNLNNFFKNNSKIKDNFLKLSSNNLFFVSDTEDNEEGNLLKHIILYGAEDNQNFLYNNSAQIWNHNLFWQSLKNNNIQDNNNLNNFMETHCPLTYQQVTRTFGSFIKFVEEIITAPEKVFGNIWIWIVFNKVTEEIQIKVSPNAGTLAIHNNFIPLLVIDLWEHSFYVDYQEKKAKFLNTAINYLNWELLEGKLRHLLA